MKKLILLTILCFSVNSLATLYFYDKGLPVKKGSKITITNHTKLLNGVFEGYVEGYDGEGLFYTRAEYLAKSIKGLTFKEAHQKPSTLIDKKFVLKSDLDTVIPPPNVPEEEGK